MEKGEAAATNYPAFNYAATYSITAGLIEDLATRWYMPSISELCELYKNIDILNVSLVKVEGTQLKNSSYSYYWSSSQTSGYDLAWSLSFSDGYLYGGGKNGYNYVCCVRSF